MKPVFRKLFSFTKPEIDWAFQRVSLVAKTNGVKLLQTPALFQNGDAQEPRQEVCEVKHGKILIIIPGKAGKAYRRNLLKRRVKAIFYEQKLYLKPITSIFIVGTRNSLDLTYDRLKEFLVASFK